MPVRGKRAGRELEEVGRIDSSEHGEVLTPGKERGKADRWEGRKSLRLQPRYEKICGQVFGEP